MPWSGKDAHYIDFGEAAYRASPAANYDFDTPLLRYSYTSMSTPD
jgi:oligopeptidase B